MIKNISTTKYIDIPEEVQLLICGYLKSPEQTKYRLLCKETFEVIEKNAASLYSPDELKIKNYYAEYCKEQRIFDDELKQLHSIKLCDLHSNMEKIIKKLKKQQRVVDVIISENTYLFFFDKFNHSCERSWKEWTKLQTPYSHHLFELFDAKIIDINRIVKNIFNSRSQINFLDFPEELQIEICKFLPSSSLNTCRRVSKEMFNFIEKNSKLFYPPNELQIKIWYKKYCQENTVFEVHAKMQDTLSNLILQNKEELSFCESSFYGAAPLFSRSLINLLHFTSNDLKKINALQAKIDFLSEELNKLHNVITYYRETKREILLKIANLISAKYYQHINLDNCDQEIPFVKLPISKYLDDLLHEWCKLVEDSGSFS